MWMSELSVKYGLGQTPKDVDEEDVHVFYVPSGLGVWVSCTFSIKTECATNNMT